MVAPRRHDHDHSRVRARQDTVGTAARLLAPLAQPRWFGRSRRMRTHPDVHFYVPAVVGGGLGVPRQGSDSGAMCTVSAAEASPDDGAADATASAPAAPAVLPAAAAAAPTDAVVGASEAAARPLPPLNAAMQQASATRRPRKNPNPRYVPPGSRSGASSVTPGGPFAHSRPHPAAHVRGRCGCGATVCRQARPSVLSPPRQALAPPKDDTPPSDDVLPTPPDPIPSPLLPMPPSAAVETGHHGVRMPEGTCNVRGDLPRVSPGADSDVRQDGAGLSLIACNESPLWPGAIVWTLRSSGEPAQPVRLCPPLADARVTAGVSSASPRAGAVKNTTSGHGTAPSETPDGGPTSGASVTGADAAQDPEAGRPVLRSVSAVARTVTAPPVSFNYEPDCRAPGLSVRPAHTHHADDRHPHRTRFSAYHRPLLEQARAAARGAAQSDEQGVASRGMAGRGAHHAAGDAVPDPEPRGVARAVAVGGLSGPRTLDAVAGDAAAAEEVGGTSRAAGDRLHRPTTIAPPGDVRNASVHDVVPDDAVRRAIEDGAATSAADKDRAGGLRSQAGHYP